MIPAPSLRNGNAALAVADEPTSRLRKPADLAGVNERSPMLSSDRLEATALAFQQFRQNQNGDVKTVDVWCQGFAGPQEHAELFRALHCQDPNAADRLAEALTRSEEHTSELQSRG